MIGDILQPTHLLFILVVALLVLGPKRLPEAGKSLGKSMRDFRQAMAGIEEHTHDIKRAVNEPLPEPTALPAAPAEIAPVQPAEAVAVAEPVAAVSTTADASATAES